MKKKLFKFMFHFVSLSLMLVITIRTFFFSTLPNNWIQISLFILVFSLIIFIVTLIVFSKARKKTKESEDLFSNMNEEELETQFELNYSGLNIIFKEEGLYFVEDNGFISYNKITFTAYITNDYKKKIYNLNIEISNKKMKECDNDYIKLTKDVIYWINKYNIHINNLDIINQENKELVTEKIKINKYNQSLLLIFSWIFMSFFFGIAISFKFIILGILLSSLVTGSIACATLINRKTLIITNLGITLKQIDQTVSFDASFHIPYQLIESITITDKVLIINGRYSKIDFISKPKVIDFVSKYFPDDKIIRK